MPDYLPSTNPSLQLWEKLFYNGNRLHAEVKLHSSRLSGLIDKQYFCSGLSLIHRSFGCPTSIEPINSFSAYQHSLAEPLTANHAWNQLLPVADIPDALLFWALCRRLPSFSSENTLFRIRFLQRLMLLVYRQYPLRPDLFHQILKDESTGAFLKTTPSIMLTPGQCYSRAESYLPQLQAAWVQGRYESMWLTFLRFQVYGRYFPLSDHHIRGLSVIGEDQRSFEIFKRLYLYNPSGVFLSSVSNLFFMALGCAELDHVFLRRLASHFDELSKDVLPAHPSNSHKIPPAAVLKVDEKPLLCVLSSDLRQHPVGRFWLPIARHLRSRFRVICIAGNPRDSDPIRSELRDLSDEWWPLEVDDVTNISRRISDISPSILVDLGGHTADNHPVFLSQRLATLQVSYLGFYGPTYASCCDWWIVDNELSAFISSSYPDSEPLWSLPGPSLCYIPKLHNLPDLNCVHFRESSYPVFGSFNHTRKLTRETQIRFGEILAANPQAVLRFRSHSFHDSSIRRRFMLRFIDMGISPHQLQPIPYAPSSFLAMMDYSSIHLHLDTYPVSGTTTTLDSLAMGVPVLTSPTKQYAGAISAAILRHVGLESHICDDFNNLPDHARWLASRYKSAKSRMDLALHVRSSPICDDTQMPETFVNQLSLMLRQKQLA